MTKNFFRRALPLKLQKFFQKVFQKIFKIGQPKMDVIKSYQKGEALKNLATWIEKTVPPAPTPPPPPRNATAFDKRNENIESAKTFYKVCEYKVVRLINRNCSNVFFCSKPHNLTKDVDRWNIFFLVLI